MLYMLDPNVLQKVIDKGTSQINEMQREGYGPAATSRLNDLLGHLEEVRKEVTGKAQAAEARR